MDKTIDFVEFYQRFRDNPPTFTGVPVTVMVPLPYLRQLADVHSRLERIEALLQDLRPGTAAFERYNPGITTNEVTPAPPTTDRVKSMSTRELVKNVIWESVMEGTAWCGWTDRARAGLIAQVYDSVNWALDVKQVPR